MQLIRNIPDQSDAATAVAIGNFDGLHQGHQAVLAAMVLAASAKGLVPSVLTFEPHPRRFFSPHSPTFRLERLATKLARLKRAGVKRVYMPRFDAHFAAHTAQAFLDELLRARMGAQAVVTGDNFAFGKGRGGDVAMLRAWGAEQGVTVITVPPVLVEDEVCSSSAIRHAIERGDMRHAAQLLGHDYMLSGRVVHGDGRGAGIGFATANIALSPQLKLPAHGVYAVRATIAGGRFDAVANFGVRPTMKLHAPPVLEVHLFDPPGMIYGQRMEVAFIEKIRDEMKFDSLSALTTQIAMDCRAAKEILSQPMPIR